MKIKEIKLIKIVKVDEWIIDERKPNENKIL
jgi:hypothetical protein